MRRLGPWLLVALAAVVVACLYFWSFVPLFGTVSYIFLPTAILVLASFAVGALVVSVRRVGVGAYWGATLAAFALLTTWGLQLRLTGDRTGAAGVRHETTVDRPVTARLGEPLLLDAARAVYYDRALFDTMLPACAGDCIALVGMEWYRLRTSEEPRAILARMGLQPAAEGDARIAVTVRHTERAGRVEIDAQVADRGNVTARFAAVVPHSERQVESWLPGWPRYALENNPILVAALPKRKLLERDLLKTFLAAAIVLEERPDAPEFDVTATQTSIRELSPPLEVSMSNPDRFWWKSPSEGCEGTVSVDRPPNGWELLTFAASSAPAPQARLAGNEMLMCAGEAVYVNTYEHVPPPVLHFARYDLEGRKTAILRVRLAYDIVTTYTFIAFDPRSLSERDGKLRFVARRLTSKESADALATTQTTPPAAPRAGGKIALVDREAEYEVALPAEILSAP
jgi:hypothetical protein